MTITYHRFLQQLLTNLIILKVTNQVFQQAPQYYILKNPHIQYLQKISLLSDFSDKAITSLADIPPRRLHKQRHRQNRHRRGAQADRVHLHDRRKRR